jgi:hypothetical protein
VYKSPFDSLVEMPFEEYACFMQYVSPVRLLLEELDYIYQKKTHLERDMVTQILHPARIIRGMIEYSMNSCLPVPLSSAIEFSLNTYRQDDCHTRLKGLVSSIEEQCPEFLDYKVSQPLDQRTWNAYNPRLTEKTKDSILERTHGEELTIIALAHEVYRLQ